MVKVARGKGEDARVTIRSIRRKAMDELHRIVRDGEAGEDEVSRAEKELQGATDRYVHQVDDLVAVAAAAAQLVDPEHPGQHVDDCPACALTRAVGRLRQSAIVAERGRVPAAATRCRGGSAFPPPDLRLSK